MSPDEHILARSRAYGLFASLYARGLTPQVWPVVAAAPGLAAHLPGALEADAAAADHYSLFGLEVFPYAGVFLSAEARMGGEAAARMEQWFGQTGFRAAADAEGADHVAHALGLLAWLTAAEAEALADGASAQAARMQRLQQSFLRDVLLPWLPAFVHAVTQQEFPFYTALAHLTLEVVLDHRAMLGAAGPMPDRAPSEAIHPDTIPPDAIQPASAPDLLASDKTGLKDIAAFLATPAWSGLFLSRSAIGRLGRAEELPRGFGARTQTLANLLRAAAEFDRMPGLLDALLAKAEAAQAFYDTLSETPVSIKPWRDRLTATRALLTHMRTASLEAHG